MRTILMLKTLILILILTALGTTAQAVDMTGTWTGNETCKCFNDVVGKFTEKYTDEVIRVSQDGTDLNIEAYGELFNGNVINDPKRERKGEASLISCNADPADNGSFGELGRAKVWAKSNGGGKMVIDSLWNAQENELCQCRARFRRVNTTNPEISECSESEESRIDAWHDAMLERPPTAPGCYELVHPETEWMEVGCGEALTGRSPSEFTATGAAPLGQSLRSVGNGSDFVVTIEDGHFTQVTGSFENVIGVTSITSGTGTSQKADHWSLQLNTNNFKTPKCDVENGLCMGWQQFVYANQGSHGELFIQYSLLEYTYSWSDSDAAPRTCPSGWTPDGYSCYRNSSVKSLAGLSVSDLEHVHLSGISGPTTDQAILRIDDTLHVHATPTDIESPDEMLGLHQKWTDAEFNIFGSGGGNGATFNANSSLNVTLTVDEHDGGHITCERGGTTGETNNLFLKGECSQVVHSTPPKFQFTQDSSPIPVTEYTGSCTVPPAPCNGLSDACVRFIACRCKAGELPLILGSGQYRGDFSYMCKYAVNWES